MHKLHPQPVEIANFIGTVSLRYRLNNAEWTALYKNTRTDFTHSLPLPSRSLSLFLTLSNSAPGMPLNFSICFLIDSYWVNFTNKVNEPYINSINMFDVQSPEYLN